MTITNMTRVTATTTNTMMIYDWIFVYSFTLSAHSY